MRHTFIGLRNNSGNPVLISVYHLQRAVFACPVHNDIFYIRIVLRQHTFYGLPYGRLSVKAGSDNGYFHLIIKQRAPLHIIEVIIFQSIEHIPY